MPAHSRPRRDYLTISFLIVTQDVGVVRIRNTRAAGPIVRMPISLPSVPPDGAP